MQTSTVKAIQLAKGIDLDKAAAKMTASLVLRQPNRALYRLGGNQYVLLYSFGVVVFLGTKPEQESELRKMLHSAFREPSRKTWSDEYEVAVDPSLPTDAVEFERVRVRELTPDRVDIICRVLARSVAITHFDLEVDESIKRYKNVYEDLGKLGRLKVSPRALLRTIGTNNDILRTVLTELALLNFPQITWQDPALEKLWSDLKNNFNLEDRFDRLGFKLDYLRHSTEQLLDIIQTRRANLLEVAIVILFVVDIAIVIIEFLKTI